MALMFVGSHLVTLRDDETSTEFYQKTSVWWRTFL